MLLTVLVSLLCSVACQSARVLPSQRQELIPTNSFSTSNDNGPNYFVLTQDGRLERIQLVFPEGAQVQTEQIPGEAENFLLTPDGRLERLQEEPRQSNEVAQYFQLTEDGRLKSISKDDVPADAKEESGEYHVLLPGGSLQKVRFMTTTKGDLQSAKVQYQQVEPITGPVYRYASPLVRVV